VESQTTALMETDHHQPLTRHSRITDRLVDLLQAKILREELRPGDRLVEQKVARDFGVGQNPVREALIELAHKGFVCRFPRKGTYVTNLTRAQANKIERVKYVLEDLAMKLILARPNAEAADFSRAEVALDQMREATRQGNMVKFYENDMQFHRIIWALADNEYLAKALEQLVAPLFATYTMRNIHPQARVRTFLEGVADHEAILAALNSRSAKKLREAHRRLRRGATRFQNATLSGGRREVEEPPIHARRRAGGTE